ncbi:MAG: diacylglycerol kinase family protein, partial [Pseudomonadota bacterium]
MPEPSTRIIINAQAGTALSLGRQRLREMLNELPDDKFEHRIVEPDALTDELTDAFRDPALQSVVVGGGDGTISQAA